MGDLALPANANAAGRPAGTDGNASTEAAHTSGGAITTQQQLPTIEIPTPAAVDATPLVCSPEDLSWPGRRQPFVNLRDALRGVGRAGGPVLASGAAYRAAELLEADRRAVPPDTHPLSVSAVVDGIQRSLVLRRFQHRPIVLAYVAAGAVRGEKLTVVAERLTVLCSYADLDWAQEHIHGIPLTALDEHHPAEVEAAVMRFVDRHRRVAERHVVQTAGSRAGVLLVDGPIRHYEADQPLVGVVKSLGDQLWIPASLLPDAFANRSPVFRIPAASRREADVFSCYLRLQQFGGDLPATHGLIRLESTSPDNIDALAAYCLQHRQNRASGDPRWPVHLGAVRLTEKILNARAPLIFDLT